MARYNVHKRKTLDRLTLTYQLMIREVLRRNSERLVGPMEAALDSGASTFEPSAASDEELEEQLTRVFQSFQNHVIKVGVSDGMQEVSIENKLGAWQRYPINMPIEDTIALEGGVALAGKRDKMAEDWKKKRRLTLREKLKEYVRNAQSSYLENIRKAFSAASKNWLAGESETKEVRKCLQKALVYTDHQAERVLRTETTNYFNETRNTYFSQQTAVDFIELYAVTDGRVSKICEDRHQLVVPIQASHQKKYMPAFHPNCRTIQRPLFSSIKSHKSLIDSHLSKAYGGPVDESRFTPLPKGWA